MNSNLILDQPGFVLANARVLARASAAAYLVPVPGEAPSANPEPAGVSIVAAVTDTHARLTKYDDCIVIAFRGTKDLRNWITDAEFGKRRVRGTGLAADPVGPPAKAGSPGFGCAHAGFLTAIESVLPQVGRELAVLGGLAVTPCEGTAPAAQSPKPEARTPDPKPLVLTGHSLGGALAVLCAWFLQRRGYAVHSVYTFGQPRVGDAVFADHYEAALGARTFRLVNQNDLVPRLPGWLLGYRHAGRLVFINVAGYLLCNPSLLSQLTSDAIGLYRAYHRLDDVLINDHFMGQYLDNLNGPNIS